MKNVSLYSLFVLVVSLFQAIDATQDYSKMSHDQLNKALVLAVEKNVLDDVHGLIQAGVDVNQEITYVQARGVVTNSVIEYAAECGYLGVVQELIQGNIKPKDLDNALVAAASTGYEDVVKVLMQSKITVDGMNRAVIAAANECHGQGCFVLIIQELIRAGAHVNYQNAYGETILMNVVDNSPYRYAISRHDIIAARKKNRIELLQFLLQAHVDVNCVDRSGNTALMIAVKNHDLDFVQLLLQVPQITINHANNEGNTALILSVAYLQTSYIQGNQEQYDNCIINSQKILETFLETPGINFHHINKNGDTAITLLNKIFG
jgi:ankyrin repeat protein